MYVNVDPLNSAGGPSAADLRQAGFTGVRLVSRPGVEGYCQAIQAAGLGVLAVVTDQSAGHVFGGPDVWQFGNEPDVSGTADYMPDPVQYAAGFRFYQQTYPQLNWITAGLASGQPDYLRQVLAAGVPGAIGYGVHPYGKKPEDVFQLLGQYWQVSPQGLMLPSDLWVTEWHRPDAEIPGMVQVLRESAAFSAYFCWSEGMVHGMGLTETAKRLLSSV